MFHPLFIEKFQCSKHLVILTGAGVSAESGIPTFRDPLTGIWEQYDPVELCSIQAFNKQPELVTRWHDELRINMLNCDPNPAHFALAEIQRQFQKLDRRFTLITQNIDGMHQRAGSTEVIEMHGSLLHWRDLANQQRLEFTNPHPFESYPPQGAEGMLRPDIIWFGEMLDSQVMKACYSALENADLFIAVGTSGMVAPASTFLAHAGMMGASTAIINLEAPANHDHADFFIQCSAGEALTRISAWF